jgi:hypothetical protein
LILPLGISGVLLSSMLWVSKEFNAPACNLPLHVSIWSYVFYAFNSHYYAFASVYRGVECQVSGLTLLNVNLALHSPLWILFQWLGDVFVLIFSLVWLAKDVGSLDMSFPEVVILLELALVIKIIGFSMRLYKRNRDVIDGKAEKVSSGIVYVICLLASMPCAILIAFDLENPKNPPYPVVTSTFPIYFLIMKTIWNTLSDFYPSFRLVAMFPFIIAELFAFLILDLNLTIFPSVYILSPLGVYGLLFLLVFLNFLWKVLRALSILCCRGCSRRSLKLLFT